MALAGIQVFDSLHEAIEAGFHIFDKTPEGYLMRIHLPSGFAFAYVIVKT